MSSRKTKNAGIIVMHRMYQNERRKLPLLLAIMDMTNGPTQELPLSVSSKKLKSETTEKLVVDSIYFTLKKRRQEWFFGILMGELFIKWLRDI